MPFSWLQHLLCPGSNFGAGKFGEWREGSPWFRSPAHDLEDSGKAVGVVQGSLSPRKQLLSYLRSVISLVTPGVI